MTDLPVDVADGDLNHTSHHNTLHGFYNQWRTYDPTAFDAATLEGSTLAEVIAAAAPLVSGVVTATLTGDGSTLTFPAITHNLGTAQLDVLLLEADGQPLTYGNEYSYTATTTTLTVTIDRWGDGVGDSPLPNAVTVSVFVRKASDAAALDRLPLYTLTGFTATLPYSADANYADLAAFEAAIVPTEEFQAVRLAGWPAAGSFVGLEFR